MKKNLLSVIIEQHNNDKDLLSCIAQYDLSQFELVDKKDEIPYLMRLFNNYSYGNEKNEIRMSRYNNLFKAEQVYEKDEDSNNLDEDDNEHNANESRIKILKKILNGDKSPLIQFREQASLFTMLVAGNNLEGVQFLLEKYPQHKTVFENSLIWVPNLTYTKNELERLNNIYKQLNEKGVPEIPAKHNLNDWNTADKVYYGHPIHYAVNNNLLGMLKIFKEHNFDFQKPDLLGRPPVLYSTHKRIVDFLVKHKVNVNEKYEDKPIYVHLTKTLKNEHAKSVLKYVNQENQDNSNIEYLNKSVLEMISKNKKEFVYTVEKFNLTPEYLIDGKTLLEHVFQAEVHKQNLNKTIYLLETFPDGFKNGQQKDFVNELDFIKIIKKGRRSYATPTFSEHLQKISQMMDKNNIKPNKEIVIKKCLKELKNPSGIDGDVLLKIMDRSFVGDDPGYLEEIRKNFPKIISILKQPIKYFSYIGSTCKDFYDKINNVPNHSFSEYKSEIVILEYTLNNQFGHLSEAEHKTFQSNVEEMMKRNPEDGLKKLEMIFSIVHDNDRICVESNILKHTHAEKDRSKIKTL